MTTKKKEQLKLFGKSGLVALVAAGLIGIGVIYSKAQGAIELCQMKIVKPVAEAVFVKSHAPSDSILKVLIRNTEIIIEMHKIALGDSAIIVKNRAIDIVENAGKL